MDEGSIVAEICKKIEEIAKFYSKGNCIIDAVVTAVDEDKMTCDIKDVTGVARSGVPLEVLINVTGAKDVCIVVIPEINSPVLIGFRHGNINMPQILKVHKAAKILLKCDNIVFNNGTDYMVYAQKCTDQLNKIEQDLNNLKTAFNTWVTFPNDGGAALKAAAATWAGSQLQQTTVDNIKDEKIKH